MTEELNVTALAPEDGDSETKTAEPTKGSFKKTDTSGRPTWCKPFPNNFQIPRGKKPIFVRFRADWTDTPHLGERQCVCWGLTVGEEYIADKRSDDSGSRALHERTKLSIRLIGSSETDTLVPVDPTKSVREADVDIFWEQIGLKCRTLLTNVFIQTHSLNADERRDFFENCIEVRDAV